MSDFTEMPMESLLGDGVEIKPIEIPKQDEYKGFLFLPSFRESYDELAKDDPELANELLWAIVVYGTQEEEVAEHPAIKAIMRSIIRTIDAGKDRRVKKQGKKA